MAGVFEDARHDAVGKFESAAACGTIHDRLRARTDGLEERAELGPIPITLQREPARRLAHLSQFPIAVVTAESSMFLGFDRHLVEFLAQGGCDVELVRLADRGVHGNGHMMMIERNNAETLAVLTGWAAHKLAA